MTWSLNASGHTPAPEGESGWEAVEQKLHDELSAVLSKPEYGCTQSHFGGNHVTGDALHIPQGDPSVEHVHETSSPGQRAYEAYCEKRGGKSVHGEGLPGWDDQDEDIREAWEAAAAAAG